MPWFDRMTPFEQMSIALGVLSVIVIPLVVFLIRGAVKWTRVESKLESIVEKLGEIVADKDKIHAELIAQMRDDRRATDERLRWLERRRTASEVRAAKP